MEAGAAEEGGEPAAPSRRPTADQDRHPHDRGQAPRGRRAPSGTPNASRAEDRQPAEARRSRSRAHVPAPGEALAVQQAEAMAMLRRVIEQAPGPLRWPMYVRNVKQLLRAADSSFDERRYGFGGILDLLRASQRDALLRLERDRQGVLRVFPGNALQRPSSAPPVQEATIEEPVHGFEAPAPVEPSVAEAAGPVESAETIAGVPEAETPSVIDAETIDVSDVQPEAQPAWTPPPAPAEAAAWKPGRAQDRGGAQAAGDAAEEPGQEEGVTEPVTRVIFPHNRFRTPG